MSIRHLIFPGLLFCGSLLLAQEPLVLTIHPDEGEHTISRHIYGHFAEHLGRCIYGGIYVGEDQTTIPTTAGVRNDIIAALRDLDIPNLRWPGGCFADTYHWKDGIGPPAERPTIVNQWWGGVTEDNSFGTHEFLNLCELLEAEPYLSLNVGSGTVREAEEWLQYTTHNGQSPMADLRRENGREAPWSVSFWGVGNEAWGCGGNMTAAYYANIYRQYATYLRDWNLDDQRPVIRIASGASGGDYHWTEVLMQQLKPNLVDALALHHYAVTDWSDKGPSVNFDEAQYFGSMQAALKMEEFIDRHTNIMDRYDPEKKIALYVDEWGGWYDTEPEFRAGVLFQQNTMRDAVLAGTTLNIFNNHCDRVKMANLAQTVNVLQAVILTEEEKMILTPTYHVMHMFKVHQDATLLPVHESREVTYQLAGEVLSALSTSASQSDAGVIHVSVVNIAARESHRIRLRLATSEVKEASAEILRANQLQAHNDFEHPERVRPREFDDFLLTANGELELVIPPASVLVVALKP